MTELFAASRIAAMDEWAMRGYERRSSAASRQNCWRVETAERFAFVVDGADYFVALRKALLKARHSIMLVGWDFDTRINIGECTDGGPQQLGISFSGWPIARRLLKFVCCAGIPAPSRHCCGATCSDNPALESPSAHYPEI